MMETMEVELWRPLELQGIRGELQEELQGKGGKVQVDLPWHRDLTQESGEEEMQISEVLADRTPTWEIMVKIDIMTVAIMTVTTNCRFSR